MAIFKGSMKFTKDATDNWKLSFPDWSRRTSKATNKLQTATQYGYILMRNTEYTNSLQGFINGVSVYNQHGAYGNFEDWNSAIFPVTPGTTYQLNGGGELAFIPAVGN